MGCSKCDGYVTKKEMNYSIRNYGKILCRDCQNQEKRTLEKHKKSKARSTPQAQKLYETLCKMGVPAKLEQWDHHKHIDIAIPKSKVNIEVDGMQHLYSHKQALADLKRTFYSFRKGYVTLRIPNKLISEKLYETAKYIKKLIDSSNEQLEDEEYW